MVRLKHPDVDSSIPVEQLPDGCLGVVTRCDTEFTKPGQIVQRMIDDYESVDVLVVLGSDKWYLESDDYAGIRVRQLAAGEELVV